MIVKVTYDLKRIDECMDTLVETEHFIMLEVSSDYWQMNIQQKYRHKTALVAMRERSNAYVLHLD